MKTTYLVWKDPTCGGINPDWQEISGQEFLALVRAKTGRRFIRLDSSEPDGSDGAVVMEATEAAYKDWRKEKRHKQYLRDSDPGYKVVSYHAMETEDGCFGEELLSDPEAAFENRSIDKLLLDLLPAALEALSAKEYSIIYDLYLCEKPKTLRALAAEMGIHFTSLNERKQRILKKLQNLNPYNP